MRLRYAVDEKLYTLEFSSRATLEVYIDKSGDVHQAQAFLKPGKVNNDTFHPEIYANFPGKTRVTLGQSTITEVRETYGYWRENDESPKNYTMSERLLWGAGNWSYGWSAIYGDKEEKRQGIYMAAFTATEKALNWETDYPSKKVQLMKMEVDE